MSTTIFRSRCLVSQLSEDGTMDIWMETVDVPQPGPGKVVVRMEGAPVHSSDIHKLFGPIDIDRLEQVGSACAPRLVAPLLPGAMEWQKNRLGLKVSGGSEGVGTVVAVGEGADTLMSRRVSVWNSSTYCDYQSLDAVDCIAISEQVDVADAAAAFNNPLTALGIVETARRFGYKALINTAAASNVGRMLARICQQDGIGLISIVRRPALAQQLRDLGAHVVLDSSAEDFPHRLTDAIHALGAMVCFDAVGGKLAGTILSCMEASARKNSQEFAPYGSSQPRHYFMYGALDPAPMEIPRSAGQSWVCSGWRFRQFLKEAPSEDVRRLLARIESGLGSTFKGHFSRTIDLPDVLQVDTAREFFQRSTDSKTLIKF